MLNKEEILEAIGLAYTHKANENKVVDADLAIKIAEEILKIVENKKLTNYEIDHTWFNHGWGSVNADDLRKFAYALQSKLM